MHHITEDTPPDMLAGAMDLSVRLPDGRDVNMAVERSTPMMDLLVQVTTAYKLRPSDHIIQALDMSERERALPYKPNTPIGALDTQRIRVLPKGKPPAPRAPPPPGHQPFESTFRLQVHLPRNQFCVIRVGKFVMLEDIMKKVCEEKNLDPRKYEFRHPANIDKVLDPKRTLNDYEITEITVVHRGTSHLSQTISSSDIMALQREEERRKLQAKTGGGVLNLIFRRGGRTSMGSGSVSSDTRSISPTQSDDSRSVTPPAVQPPILPPIPQEVKQPPNRPKAPQRKRRPAPKPPSQPTPAAEVPPQPAPAQELQKCQQEVTTKLENGLTICHSRNSSDSSGYHEASILSDNCTTLPRRPKSTVINSSLTNSTLSVDQGMEISKSTGNLSNMTTQSKSTMSLTNAGRKKKAPPPPPMLKSASSVANISTSDPVVASSSDLESNPKVQSDNSSPAMNNDSIPRPKPRTIKAAAPVPSPRRIFTNSEENLSLPAHINLNQTPINNYHSIPNSFITDDSRSLITNSEPETADNRDLEYIRSTNSSDSQLSNKSAISNERNDSKIARERGFQIGRAMLSMDDQNQEFADTSSIQTINSSSSSQYIPEEHFEHLEIDNIDMFNSKSKQNAKKHFHSHKSHAFAEIHDLEQNKTYEEVLSRTVSYPEHDLASNDSMLSLRSLKSVPTFMNSDINMKKWGNVQNLDEDDYSLGSSHHWVVGDSDAESTCPATSSDILSLPRTSDASLNTLSLNSFNQDSSSQQLSRSNLTIPDITEDSATSTPVYTSTPSRPQSRQSSSTENIALEKEKIIIQSKTEEMKQSRKENTISEIEPERKMSIIEIERKLSLEMERKQSLTKDVNIVEQRNQSLSKDVSVVEQRNESLIKDDNEVKQKIQSATKDDTIVEQSKPSLSKDVNVVEQTKQSLVKEVVPQPVFLEKKTESKVETDIKNNLTEAQKICPVKTKNEESEDFDTDWQYTLPSPPKAFRDSSPTNFTDVTNYDTITFNGLTTDSVVSNPTLFEKLESIKDTRSDTETIISESSLSSKQEEVLTSKYLNLENLEKRKSLVLERELASLKIAQNQMENSNSKNSEVENSLKSQRDNLKNEIEEVIQQKSKSSTLSRSNSQSREKLLLSVTDSTLPNFKLTTYDQPKSKINIYEDDTIRSNVENKSANTSKRNSIVDLNKDSSETDDLPFMRKKNPLVNVSTDNMFFTKRNSTDEFMFKKPQEPSKYRKQTSITNLNDLNNFKSMDTVSRSESFSMKNNFWSRSNPVKRSKSHISLDKYKDDNKNIEDSEEGLHKSSSLFNVSGLQSLEVMRMILPKLGNTPPSTPSEDPRPEPPKFSPPKPEPAKISPPAVEPAAMVPAKQEPPAAPPKPESLKETITRKYQYSGPPAINLGTWSERPKSQISLKEDQDYKISNISAMKAKFNSQSNLNTVPESRKLPEQQNYPSVNIRVNSSEPKDQVDSGKINIKINSDPPKTISHQSSGNVIIKIGNNESNNVDDSHVKPETKPRENNFYSRFLNQTTAVGYRKPLGNINGVDKPRPHSIAFDANCPDLSRVPIVRAVELKKPFKDSQVNKSVTQIIHDSPVKNLNDVPNKNGSTEYNNSPVKSNTLRHSSVYLSSENLNKVDQNGPNKILSLFPKPVTRGNSFATTRSNPNPVVKGFRVPANKETEMDTKHYGTLPNNKIVRTVNNNVQNFVPFSQSTLKRTENSIAKQHQPEKNIFENVVLRKTASNGLPFNRHSVGPVEVNGSSAPPPPPQMPKITAVTKKSMQRQLQVEDPRDMLLESIRNFGGKAGLRAVK